MSRIAAPMIGGMLTAPLLSMFVIPAAYLLMRSPKTRRRLRLRRNSGPDPALR
jgi:Cu(I)/Ag(I) efflux system membrane protein CusA/SilA